MIILCHFDHKLFVIVVVGFVLCWSLRLFCIVFVCVPSVLEIKSGSFNEEGVCVCVCAYSQKFLAASLVSEVDIQPRLPCSPLLKP